MSGAEEDFLTSDTMRKHREAMARAEAGIKQAEQVTRRGEGYKHEDEGTSESREPYIVEVTEEDEGSLGVTSGTKDTSPAAEKDISSDMEPQGSDTATAEVEEGNEAEAGKGEGAEKEEKEEEEEEEEELTPEELETRVARATALKGEGNELYKEALWEGAVAKYSEALEEVGLPKRHEARAALYCNRAAARAQLHLHKEVVTDCDAALELQPSYLKARLRKAQALEDLEKPSDALKEYEAALKFSPSLSVAKKAVARLPQEIEEKQKRDQEEMMGKLKEMGNSLLGLVGLSLDNFQFTQDPNTGGYSVNMTNN